MEKIIRKIIRESLEELLEMRVVGTHFPKRVNDRLVSDDTTFRDEDEQIKKVVFDNIEFLKKVDIDTQDNIAFLLLKGPRKYVYHREIPSENKIEHSEGPFVWAIVRGNELETVVFGEQGYKPKNTQIQLPVSKLKDYIEHENNGNFKITEKDLKKILFPKKQEHPMREKPSEHIINILGVKWVFDKGQEKLYKKNNPSIGYSVWDVLDDNIEGIRLDDSKKEELLSAMLS